MQLDAETPEFRGGIKSGVSLANGWKVHLTALNSLSCSRNVREVNQRFTTKVKKWFWAWESLFKYH